MRGLLRRLFALSTVAALAFASAATASPITPGGYANTEGNDGNSIPFSAGFNVDRYQQVYDAAGFGGASGTVSSVAFRLDGIDSHEPGFTALVLDLLVSLSHTAVNSETISTDLGGNIGADATVVFDGLVQWTGTQLPGGGPNPFDLLIDFDDVFVYNGTQNLLLDVTVRSRSSFDTHYLDADFLTAPFGRAWFFAGGNLGAGFNTKLGLVSQFDLVSPANVPEPALSFLLVAGGLAWRRRNRRHLC